MKAVAYTQKRNAFDGFMRRYRASKDSLVKDGVHMYVKAK